MENKGVDKIAINLAEAGKLIGISYPYMLRMATEGTLPAFRIGKKWLVNKAMFVEWVAKQAGGDGR